MLKLLMLPPRPPKTLLHHLTLGKSFPPPDSGPSSTPSPRDGSAHTDPRRELSGETQGTKVFFEDVRVSGVQAARQLVNWSL